MNFKIEAEDQEFEVILGYQDGLSGILSQTNVIKNNKNKSQPLGVSAYLSGKAPCLVYGKACI